MGKDCPFIHSQRRIDLSVQRTKVKEKSPNKERWRLHCEYCKSPSELFREALQVRNIHEQRLESRGNSWAKKTSQNASERHYCAWKKTFVRKEKHQIFILEFGKSKVKRQISISERDQDRQQERKISKCTIVRPKIYRVGRGARRVCKTWSTQTSQRALQVERTQPKQTSSDVMSLHRRWIPRQAGRYIPKKGSA